MSVQPKPKRKPRKARADPKKPDPCAWLVTFCQANLQSPAVIVAMANTDDKRRDAYPAVIRREMQRGGLRPSDFDEAVIKAAKEKLPNGFSAPPAEGPPPEPPTATEFKEEVKKLNTKPKKTKQQPRSRKGGPTLFGHPISLVIRALGRLEWSRSQIQKVLDHFDVVVPYKTVDTQAWVGKRTDKPAPKFTREQLKQLTGIRDK
jgi:hypothetical protein